MIEQNTKTLDSINTIMDIEGDYLFGGVEIICISTIQRTLTKSK